MAGHVSPTNMDIYNIITLNEKVVIKIIIKKKRNKNHNINHVFVLCVFLYYYYDLLI